jgi:hypothetical protein
LRGAGILLVPLATALLACNPANGDTNLRPNLVLITLDTLRADHLQRYGYSRNTAPRLEEFADESVVFERCMAPIAVTMPSHLSLLTSTYPYEHGRTANFDLKSKDPLAMAPFVGAPGLISIAQHLAERGYETAGFVSAVPLKKFTGLSTGFQTWSEPQGARRTGAKTLERLFGWLDDRSDERPFLLWAHFFDAHGPYVAGSQPPEPCMRLSTVSTRPSLGSWQNAGSTGGPKGSTRGRSRRGPT